MAQKTKLMEEFEDETGENAIWRGEVTKQFKEWKEENKPSQRESKTVELEKKKEDVFIFNSTIKGEEESENDKNEKEASLEEYYDDITEDFLAIMRLYLMKEGIEPTEANLWKALDIFFKGEEELKA